ncbi:MAG TPA: inositol monophosphatase family protein [Candidatus Eisenbacteria bacterium]|nr:inositol monophosphatase family protein [Candidatus Eisenbacteria bacterium]
MKKKTTPLTAAVEAALKGGRVLLASYGKLKDSQISMKAKNDFVTAIDKKSEKTVIGSLRRHFPSDTIQAEESGVTAGQGRLWIIDPLDGTSNYIHHFPQFSISIGVMEGGRLTTGVIYDPLHKELFTAERGKGAFLNGRRIRATRVPKLATALMATGIPFRARDRFDEYLKSFEKISLGSVGLRRGGSAALDLAYVACGRFDGFWELDLSPWDVAAGAVILEEAGGRITDMWGKGDYLKSGDTLASNGLIHGELQAITASAFTPSQKDKTCRSY